MIGDDTMVIIVVTVIGAVWLCLLGYLLIGH